MTALHKPYSDNIDKPHKYTGLDLWKAVSCTLLTIIVNKVQQTAFHSC